MNKKHLPLSLALLLAVTTAFAADASSRHPSGSAPSGDAASSSSNDASSSSGSSSRPEPSESAPSDGVLDRHPSGSAQPSATPDTPSSGATTRHPSGSVSSSESPSGGPSTSSESARRDGDRTHRHLRREDPGDQDSSVEAAEATAAHPASTEPKSSFWILGVGVMPLSVSLGWTHYEAEHWRYAAVWQVTDEIMYSGGEVAWVPGQRNASPYVSLGLGLVGRLDDHQGDDTLGGGLKVEAGLELLHHSNVRALVGANVILPFQDRGDVLNIGLHFRMCF